MLEPSVVVSAVMNRSRCLGLGIWPVATGALDMDHTATLYRDQMRIRLSHDQVDIFRDTVTCSHDA